MATNWTQATINDVAKKYGFDFSQGYANRQAAVEAQAERNTYNNSIRQNNSLNQNTMKTIDNGMRESSSALDHDYFQKYLAQQQAQAGAGLNAGIAADQNTRMAFQKQSQFSNVLRDAQQARTEELSRYNLEAQRLAEALGLVDKSEKVNAQRYYQDLLAQGHGILSNDRSFGLQYDQFAWQKQMDEAQLALQRQQLAAQQAAARARSSSSGGSSSGGASKSGSSLVSAYRNAQTQSNKSNIDRYYENQNNALKPKSVVYKNQTVSLPGNRITPANDPSLSAWSKMRMFGG